MLKVLHVTVAAVAQCIGQSNMATQVWYNQQTAVLAAAAAGVACKA